MHDRPRAILMTGFEPSGDDHAAAVVAELKSRHPDLDVYAWGGPKTAAAGARIVEPTGRDAVMGVPGLAKILEHKAINRRVAAWLDEHPVRVHVPIDSPAANFPICAMAKARGVKVVHLVAPQVWAWGTWRVKKLRRLTDFVCCLLPFEEQFFAERRVPAAFVGHPVFDRPLDHAAIAERTAAFPQGSPRIAVYPGSRPVEIRKNFPLLIEAYRRLARDYPGARGVVAAASDGFEPVLRGLAERTRAARGCEPGWPGSLAIETSATDAAAAWADLALVVSGTVTLQIARHGTPMVALYRSNPWVYWTVARWLLRTKLFTLPNLLARERVIPEFVPYFGGPQPIVDAAVDLLEQPERAEAQRRKLAELCAMFGGRTAAVGAADAIERVAGLPRRAHGDRPAARASA